MMAGRPRKPTKLHVLEGTRPGATNRDRGGEPECRPLGEPPERFLQRGGKAKLAIWQEVVRALPPGVITESDRFTLEIVVELLNDLRKGRITGAGMSSLQRGLASLGMTPADRSKVGVGGGGKPKEESPWDRLQ